MMNRQSYVFLQLDPVAQAAYIVPQVQLARGAISGQNSLAFHLLPPYLPGKPGLVAQPRSLLSQFLPRLRPRFLTKKRPSSFEDERSACTGAPAVPPLLAWHPTKKSARDGGKTRHASLTLAGTALRRASGDTLCPDNGGDSGPDYWPPGGVRRATPRPIHCLRWYRASTLPRLSRPRFGGYYS